MASGRTVLNTWENAPRRGPHGRNAGLEQVLERLNDRLRAGKPNDAVAPTGHPLVFLVGCARSGSTLLLQWLATSGVFAVPTNIVSRFPGDPTVGALVHRALYELDDRGEIFPERSAGSVFRSTLGRASGPAEPHDFGYLWKSYFRFGDTQDQLREEPSPERLRELVNDVRGMQAVFGRPFAMKALQLDWHVERLAALFPEAVLLHVHRDILDNAASLLEARREYFGDEGAWYSFRPPEYDRLKDLPPWEQCVAQVACTERAVRKGLSALPGHRVLEVDYADLCTDPAGVWARWTRAVGIDAPYSGPASFTVRRHAHAQELRERAAALLQRSDMAL